MGSHDWNPDPEPTKIWSHPQREFEVTYDPRIRIRAKGTRNRIPLLITDPYEQHWFVRLEHINLDTNLAVSSSVKLEATYALF